MTSAQRGQNPDVNTYYPDVEPGDDPGVTDGGSDSSDIERQKDDETNPVPPNSTPPVPVEEPPGEGSPPVGDVDDSPKRIA